MDAGPPLVDCPLSRCKLTNDGTIGDFGRVGEDRRGQFSGGEEGGGRREHGIPGQTKSGIAHIPAMRLVGGLDSELGNLLFN
jgi:hypothetical protein